MTDIRTLTTKKPKPDLFNKAKYTTQQEGNNKDGKNNNSNNNTNNHNNTQENATEKTSEEPSQDANDYPYTNEKGEKEVMDENNSELEQESRHQTNKEEQACSYIKILSWNVENLFDKLNEDDFCNFLLSFDLLCLSETFTYASFDFTTKFQDYTHLHCPAKKISRLGRPSGGLIILAKKHLSEHIQIIETNTPNILSLKISSKYTKTEKDILFIGTYIHPIGSVYYRDKEHDSTLDTLEQFMAEQLDQDNDYSYIISGDLNSRISDWSFTKEDTDNETEEMTRFTRRAQDTVTNSFGKKLIELCNMFDMTPLGGLAEKDFDDKFTFPSPRGSSTNDHFVCSVDILDDIAGFQTLERIESSHMPITTKLKCNKNTEEHHNTPTVVIRKVTWQEDKIAACKDILESAETQKKILELDNNLDVDADIDASVENFSEIISTVSKPMEINMHIGPRRQKNTKGWFDKECADKRKATRKTLNHLNWINKNQDPTKYQTKKQEYITARTEYQKLIKEKKITYRRITYNTLVEDSKDSKKFWSTINKLNTRKKKIANITAQQWEQHFTDLLNPAHPRSQTNSLGEDNQDPVDHTNTTTIELEIEELDKEITEEELSTALKKLKKGKAAGIDGIIAEILTLAERKIKGYLLKLFNKLYLTSQFPQKWAQAIVVPLFKKGDRHDPNNYRGISLLSITSKLYTSILNRRLYSWAEDNNKISTEQAGFRRGYSTIDHIFTLHCMISNKLFGRRRGKLYVAFIDYRKAFDTINREVLWKVLTKLKISTKFLNSLKAIYKEVQMTVRHGNQQTDLIDCPLGVKQGCLLSPLLFSLLITEVADKVAARGRSGCQLVTGSREIFSLLFADDIALISQTPAGLQNQINNLKSASEALGLKVNLDKTKVMVFRKGGYLGSREKWHYGTDELEVVNTYKYLGFTLTTKLSTDIPLREYAGRAKGKVLNIFRTLYKLGQIDIKVFFRLFDSQVKPMLLYASEIWGSTSYETIEKVHTFACKKLLGVSARTPNIAVYGELGRYPLFIDSATRSLKYWFRIQLLQDNRLPKLAYTKEKQELEKTLGWGNTLKHNLETNGFAHVWLNEGVASVNSFTKAFKQRLIDGYRQNWHAKLTDSDRFDVYRQFKETHQKEEYLDHINIAKFRKTLTRFRLGICEINTNTRFRNPTDNKDCPFCTTQETEIHFLLKCPQYAVLRTKYLAKYWITLENATLTDLLGNPNENIMQNTAMYIFYALKLREETLQRTQTNN